MNPNQLLPWPVVLVCFAAAVFPAGIAPAQDEPLVNLSVYASKADAVSFQTLNELATESGGKGVSA